MLKGFRAYQLSRELHWACKELKIPGYLREQLLRASASVALNVAEGSGKRTSGDQQRFYAIALGSLRECQAIVDLEEIEDQTFENLSDHLGAILYKLSRNPKQKPN